MPKKEHIAAIYVSVWDGGIEIRTPCKYDPATKTCFDIASSDVEGVECLEDEYVLLPDDTELRKDDGVIFDY
jgi:hypothetical protein